MFVFCITYISKIFLQTKYFFLLDSSISKFSDLLKLRKCFANSVRFLFLHLQTLALLIYLLLQFAFMSTAQVLLTEIFSSKQSTDPKVWWVKEQCICKLYICQKWGGGIRRFFEIARGFEAYSGNFIMYLKEIWILKREGGGGLDPPDSLSRSAHDCRNSYAYMCISPQLFDLSWYYHLHVYFLKIAT